VSMATMALVTWVLVAAPRSAPEGVPGTAPGTAPEVGTFVEKTLKAHGKVWRYSVYVPPGHRPGLPVLLALHGAGSRGADGLEPRKQSVVTAAQKHPERYPAVLVLPQCPRGRTWSGEAADFALAALERTVTEYRGDRSRLYLVGQSLGARGAVHLAARYPGRFAALVTVAGRHPGSEESARKLKALPIWAWHGDADADVPVEESRALVERLRAEGSQVVRYTELAGRKHDIFEDVYFDESVSRWLFEQKR
jgi:predicted peptidase